MTAEIGDVDLKSTSHFGNGDKSVTLIFGKFGYDFFGESITVIVGGYFFITDLV